MISDIRYPIGEVGWYKLPLAACQFYLSLRPVRHCQNPEGMALP